MKSILTHKYLILLISFFLGVFTSFSLPPYNFLIINFITFPFLLFLLIYNFEKSKWISFKIGWLYGLIVTCALKPTILLISSVLKPFNTDITIIKTATPRLMPINEKIEIIFKKPSFFLVFKYLKVISFSKFEINFYLFYLVKF